MMLMGAGKAKRLNYFGFGTVSRMGDLCRLGGGGGFLELLRTIVFWPQPCMQREYMYVCMYRRKLNIVPWFTAEIMLGPRKQLHTCRGARLLALTVRLHSPQGSWCPLRAHMIHLTERPRSDPASRLLRPHSSILKPVHFPLRPCSKLYILDRTQTWYSYI